MITADAVNITQDSARQADKEKRFVALSSVVAAVFLTAVKLVIGILTGSLGILSEATHSGLDLVAAVVTLVAVRVSGRPPDREHTYGHGKVENLSALFETLLLLVTCVWIIYEAIQRLFFKEVEVEASVWAFVIMISAIAIDWTRSRALSRIAKKYDSQALEADALHFSTDIWSSIVVIIGLLLVLLSNVLGIKWLAKADAVAALGVSLIVIYVSFRLGKRAVSALLDGVPAGVHQELIGAARRVPGVLDVRMLRARRSGPESFVDTRVAIHSDTPLEQAHDIAVATEEAIRKVMPGADVTVHVDPDYSREDSIVTTIRVLAGRNGLRTHGVRIYNVPGGRTIELHLEVRETLSLDEAHAQATAFERALHETLPGVSQIVTHIEPAEDYVTSRKATHANERVIQQAISNIAAVTGVDCHPHSITIHRVGGELSVSFHCVLDASKTVTDVHQFTVLAEQSLRTRIPGLGRVVIHAEPPNAREG